MKPSIGRIVHYQSFGTPNGEYPSTCRAAIVTAVESDPLGADDEVDLCVLNPEGMFFNRNVENDEGKLRRGGTWHWPERVD